MTTRKIVPRDDNEGGLGTALKRWASAFIANITVTTINALILTAQEVDFTITGGTISKTLTVDETVTMSAKAPKATPTFTGQATIPTIALTGGQIAFPATRVPSSDPNTLDDYEEGNFTPALTFGGAAVGITYNTGQTKGKYTKIGREVFYTLRMLLTSKGSSVGNALITGLPFIATSDPGHVAAQSVNAYTLTFADMLVPIIDQGAQTITVWELSNGGADSYITNADFADATAIMFSGHYVCE